MINPRFRAWHKESDSVQYMAKVCELFFDSDSVCAVRLVHELGFNKLVTDINKIELMQRTGLQDKSGIDIYEGDVIITPYGFDGGRHLVKDIRDFYWCTTELALHPEDMEIIGNIYSNPELMESRCLTHC